MEVKDLSQIHYAGYNPRILSEHMGAALDASMTTFGDIAGITFNTQTSTLVTGHQRLRLLEKRYPNRVKIYVEHRFDAPDEYGTVASGFVGVEGTNLHLAYREVSWLVEKEKAANISANKVSATFDDELLAKLNYDLSQLENGDELLALTGQTDKEIEKLLQSVGAGSEPEQPDEPKDEKGDKLTFALSKDQKEFVEQALAQVKQTSAIPHTNLNNINGTALYIICTQYVQQATSQNTDQTQTTDIQPSATEATSDYAPPAETPNLTSIPTDTI